MAISDKELVKGCVTCCARPNAQVRRVRVGRIFERSILLAPDVCGFCVVNIDLRMKLVLDGFDMLNVRI